MARLAFSHLAETSLDIILTLSKLLPTAYSTTQKLSGHSPSSSGQLASFQLFSSSLLCIISST
jgi:hypothetical protein